MKKKHHIIIIFIISARVCFAETNTDDNTTHQLSVDINYLIAGMLNQGGGLGVKYETKVYSNYFSLKGSLGHMLFKTGIKDVYCASVNMSLFINYYPFGGLDKLYLGIGNGCDFMNYFGSGKLPTEGGDTLVFLTSIAGYKFNFKPISIGVSVGYKFIIAGSDNYENIEHYVNNGIQLGLGFNLHLKEIFKKKEI
jgi:hypothetical protein